MTVGLQLPLDRIAELARRYGVAQLEVFGSALRDDFGPQSDCDFLVLFARGDYGPWMSKMGELQGDLARLLGREVDVVSRRGVERSRNPIRRQHILDSARVIYEG